MIIHDVAQGTTAWMKLRAGKPTASCFDKIITPGGKASTSADGYFAHLLAERAMGEPIDGFKSQWMERGNDYEDRAVASYELSHDCDTVRVGFVTSDDGLIGCSPDRFIVGCPAGALECKAPSAPVHVGYYLAAVGASKEYKVQLQGQLWVCEREWVDIISYHPGIPDVVFRVTRDEEFIAVMAAHVRAFSGRLEDKWTELQAKGWGPKESPAQPDGLGVLGITQDDIDAMMAERFPQVATQ